MERKYLDKYKTSHGIYGYDKIEVLPESYKNDVIEPFLLKLASQKNTNNVVLDLASGTGLGGNYIEEMGINVVKVDISHIGLSNSNGSRAQAFAERLPLSDESVLGVHMKDGLAHISDKGRLLDEVYRVLKPNGFALLVSQFIRADYVCVGKEQKKVYFDDEEDMAYFYEQIRKQYGRKTISPPYYRTNSWKILKEANEKRFNLTRLWGWTPLASEKEWHENPTYRFALMLQK